MSFKSLKGFKASKDILGRKLFQLRELSERDWYIQAKMGIVVGKERQVGKTSSEIRDRKSRLEADRGSVRAT